MPERLSAVIITRDAADLLPEYLQSVRFADEILIVDSGSQDETRPAPVTIGPAIITPSPSAS
jgi:(heptosyl)LPS beta-1,4-glucosyltransferase